MGDVVNLAWRDDNYSLLGVYFAKRFAIISLFGIIFNYIKIRILFREEEQRGSRRFYDSLLLRVSA